MYNIEPGETYKTKDGYTVYFPEQEKKLAENGEYIYDGHIQEISTVEKVPYDLRGRVNVIKNYEPHKPFEIVERIDDD